MAHFSFGDKAEEIVDIWMALLKKARTLSSMEVTLLMREYYERFFGIYDYEVESSLSHFKFHEAEDTTSNSLLYEAIRNFKDLKINEVFGYNLTEYLALPHDIFQYITELASKDTSRRLNDVETQLRNLGTSSR